MLVKVVSVAQMQAIEAAAAADGIAYSTMFERVAIAVADRILEHIRSVDEPRVAILVGGGNNGGDGLVTALRLQEIADVEIGVYLVKARSDDDEMLSAVRESGVFVAEADSDQQYRVLRNMVASAHVVVDAIFGIGARLPLEGDVAKVLRNIQQALKPPAPEPEESVLLDPEGESSVYSSQQVVIALDCPSGVNCDTGEVDKLAIKADETITFIAVKQGLLELPAAEHVGKLWVATLGIPADLDALQSVQVTYVTGQQVQQMLPQRSTVGHKGTFGKAFIVAGSVNYTGAAGLAALGAYRSGAGLVTVAAPMPVIGGLAAQMLEATWILLPHDMGVASEKAAEVITKEVGSYKAMLIGPGMGQEDTTKDLLLTLFEQTEQKPRRSTRGIGFAGLRKDDEVETETDDVSVTLPPLVLDADALNLLAKVDNWWEHIPENTIITPHPGEMARLCNLETSDVQSRRIELAIEKAAAWQTVVLLKGSHTVVAAPDGQCAVLPFKTAALSTAGTGDVLAGIIVSLLAQGSDPYNAAIVGAYIHGRAGALAEEYAGNSHSVIAGDVADLVGDVLGRLVF